MERERGTVRRGSVVARTPAVALWMGRRGWTWLKRPRSFSQCGQLPSFWKVCISPAASAPTKSLLSWLPVVSPCWALYSRGLFQAWAHRSRCLPPTRHFMSLRHLNLCQTDLHSYLPNLQLLHSFLFSKTVPARFQGIVLDTLISWTHPIYTTIQFYWAHMPNIASSTPTLHIARDSLQESDI